MSEETDLIVVGGGTAGLPTAIFAADRGAKVILIESSGELGGSLLWSNGELSGAGTKRQIERGIEDSPDEHFADVMRLSRGKAIEHVVRLAVDNAAETLDWLCDHGFDMDPDVPQIIHSHEAYSKPRTYWGLNQGRSAARVLQREVRTRVDTGAVRILYHTEFQNLLTGEEGNVIGCVVKDQSGVTHEVFANAVVLTTGGYSRNVALFEELHGYPPYMETPCPESKGRGLIAARDLGAAICGTDCAMPAFNAVLEKEGPTSQLVCRLHTIPQWRMPWEIYVNADGHRFIREDGNSVDERELSLTRQPSLRAWMVFDDTIMREAPSRYRKWYGDYAANPPEDPFNTLEFFHYTDSLEELAKEAGIDPEGLIRTVAQYNEAQSSGKDPLGRSFMPRPIETPPFYAIRFQGCHVMSFGGIAVNERLEVMREDGTAIPNLYAAGEILGGGQTMGQSNAGGMMATPAMTFGRLLGERLIKLD